MKYLVLLGIFILTSCQVVFGPSLKVGDCVNYWGNRTYESWEKQDMHIVKITQIGYKKYRYVYMNTVLIGESNSLPFDAFNKEDIVDCPAQ